MGGVIIFGVFWFLLCFAVGNYADKRGKSYGLHFLLSLFLSPLIGFIFAALGASGENSNPNMIKL